MKQAILVAIALALLLSLTNCRKTETDIVYDRKYIAEINQTRKEISYYIVRNNVPGASIAIAKDGKIIYSEGIGLASRDLEVQMTRETKLRIGEVSELFTSVIYYKLIEEGIIHPDSTIQTYLPDFPEKEFKITLKDLSNHTSGFRTPYEDETIWDGLNNSLQRGISKFENDPIGGHPGEYQELTIFNYNLLGAIMEKATNKKFKDLLKDYVTDTFKLSNTVVDNPFTTIKGRSDFFDYNIVSQSINAKFQDTRYKAPSQGIHSTAEDLVKFGMAVLHSDYLSDETRQNLFKPVKFFDGTESQLANGWILMTDREGRKVRGRSGKVVGGGATLVIIPQEDLVVAGAINITTSGEDIPVFKFVSFFLQKSEKEELKDQSKK